MTKSKKIQPTVPSAWRHPFAAMRTEMNELMNRFGVGQWDDDWLFHGSPFKASVPAVDIVENDHGFEMKAELPGLTEKDFDLEIKNGCLHLSGEKRTGKTEEKVAESGRYHVTERSFGSFSRTFTLPDGVDQSKIAAVFENGVLTVSIPVSDEKQKSTKKIPIKKTTTKATKKSAPKAA